jgi:hypothetical protein
METQDSESGGQKYRSLEYDMRIVLGLTKQESSMNSKLHTIDYANDVYENRLHICDSDKKPTRMERLLFYIFRTQNCWLPEKNRRKTEDYMNVLKLMETRSVVRTVIRRLKERYSNQGYA